MQDGAAGRRGVRENRRHDRCVVGVCGQVDENAVPLRCGFDGILLGGKQVPHALLRPGISVARVGLGGLRQVGTRVLVAGQSADDDRVLQGAHVLVEAGGERRGGMDEQANDQLVANLEVGQPSSEAMQDRHCLRR